MRRKTSRATRRGGNRGRGLRIPCRSAVGHRSPRWFQRRSEAPRCAAGSPQRVRRGRPRPVAPPEKCPSSHSRHGVSRSATMRGACSRASPSMRWTLGLVANRWAARACRMPSISTEMIRRACGTRRDGVAEVCACLDQGVVVPLPEHREKVAALGGLRRLCNHSAIEAPGRGEAVDWTHQWPRKQIGSLPAFPGEFTR